MDAQWVKATVDRDYKEYMTVSNEYLLQNLNLYTVLFSMKALWIKFP